jgi:hypothetical protein
VGRKPFDCKSATKSPSSPIQLWIWSTVRHPTGVGLFNSYSCSPPQGSEILWGLVDRVLFFLGVNKHFNVKVDLISNIL